MVWVGDGDDAGVRARALLAGSVCKKKGAPVYKSSVLAAAWKAVSCRTRKMWSITNYVALPGSPLVREIG